MHEVSLAESIATIALDILTSNSGQFVKEIELEIGTASGVELEALEFALTVVLKQRFTNPVDVKINRIEARGFCKSCSLDYLMDDLYSACPQCSGYNGFPTKGRELRVKSILIE